jgi:clan AA aspartic protease (TIGR02281 family)
MRSDLLDPDRGNGLVGWAIRQLALWLGGGFAVYWLITNYGLIRPSDAPPAVKPVQAEGPPIENQPEPTVLGRAAPPAHYSLTLRARPDGYVYVRAAVNGIEMPMAFDTGASTVVLTRADAVKAGVAGNLNFSKPVWTANGRTFAAPVELRSIRIGQLEIDDVHAEVAQNLSVSLLGQTFLSRLESYRMQDGILTLSWH